MGDPLRVPVAELTQVGDARRSAVAMAANLGFSEERRGNVAIAVTELATNLARHAKSGEIILRTVEAVDTVVIEILSVDRGPGIRSFAEALCDGFSTSSTPGNGLGAVRRLSNQFDAFTTQAGTVILSRIAADGLDLLARMPLDVGVVCLPIESETACGDAWHAADLGHGRTLIIVADGLGHGVSAAEASRKAVNLFRTNLHLNTEQMIGVLHAGLRSTRGAAVAVVELNRGTKEARFAGVGNISGSILSEGKFRSMVSHNGTLGAELHRVKEFVYPWSADGILILHSDGLKTQWNLDHYAGLRQRHPAIIAGILYRDFRRDRDDVTVFAMNSRGGVA